MNFLEKLDLLKSERGLNNKKLSEQSGIKYTTIASMYDKGYRNMKFETLEKFAKFFDVSLDYLMNDDITDRNYGKTSDDENGFFKYLKLQSGERMMQLSGLEVAVIEALRKCDDIDKISVLRILRLDDSADSIRNKLTPDESDNAKLG